MWQLADKSLNSRLLCGTALFPSPKIMRESIIASGAQVVTVALRRQAPGKNGGSSFWDFIKNLDVHILPNTAGCRTSKEAITVAQMARELFNTNWVKLEVTGDDYTLQPDPFALVEAAKILINDGFEVFPYSTSDLIVAQRLVDVGCKIIMPWAAPIGSGQGIIDPRALQTLRMRLPDITLIVDAGIGKPSHATQVMEMGFDAVLLTSAIALANDPVNMASAFASAIEAGRRGFESGFMTERAMASPSTPTIGTPFWHQSNQQKSISSNF
jgi:thiazole synthase